MLHWVYVILQYNLFSHLTFKPLFIFCHINSISYLDYFPSLVLVSLKIFLSLLTLLTSYSFFLTSLCTLYGRCSLLYVPSPWRAVWLGAWCSPQMTSFLSSCLPAEFILVHIISLTFILNILLSSSTFSLVKSHWVKCSFSSSTKMLIVFCTSSDMFEPHEKTKS